MLLAFSGDETDPPRPKRVASELESSAGSEYVFICVVCALNCSKYDNIKDGGLNGTDGRNETKRKASESLCVAVCWSCEKVPAVLTTQARRFCTTMHIFRCACACVYLYASSSSSSTSNSVPSNDDDDHVRRGPHQRPSTMLCECLCVCQFGSVCASNNASRQQEIQRGQNI